MSAVKTRALQSIALLMFSSFLFAQQQPAAVITDPPPDKVNPASMAPADINSHGSIIHAVFYRTAGAGLHPTVVLMHGFPGNEQNMDLAYAIRRAGWNVLVPHYRGSWGSEGAFSFTHSLEDMQACLSFLRDSHQADYHVDPRHIVLIGHSMGGFMVAHAAAHDPQVEAVAMIAAWNIGPSVLREKDGRYDTFTGAAPRLAGTTAQAMIAEAKKNAGQWNYVDWAPALKDRAVLVIEADDRNVADNEAMVAALRKAGDARVAEEHIHDDHVFSEHRIALQSAIVRWLQGLVK